MAYIETHQSLLTHRKTLRLSRLLSLDRFAVVGRLMALWSWALDNAQEGTIAHGDSDILADVMGWEGDPAHLCTALTAAGFLDESESGYCIHDWWDYAGRLIERRKANAEKQQRWRDRQKTDTEPTPPEPHNGNVTVMSELRNGATVPYPTVPNHTSLSGKVSFIERESARHEPKAIREPLARTRSPSRKSRTPAEPEPEPAKSRPVNPIWDALCEVFYQPATKAERSNFGKIVRELTEVGATPDDIRQRMRQHQKAQNHWDMTPNALVTHWSELGNHNGKAAATHGLEQQQPGTNRQNGIYDPEKDEAFMERRKAARLVRELGQQQTS